MNVLMVFLHDTIEIQCHKSDLLHSVIFTISITLLPMSSPWPWQEWFPNDMPCEMAISELVPVPRKDLNSLSRLP